MSDDPDREVKSKDIEPINVNKLTLQENITLLMKYAGQAYYAAQGRGKEWDISYKQELDNLSLCILGLSDTTKIVMSKSYSLAMLGPFKNPHGEWCECSGRGITFKDIEKVLQNV